MSRYIVPYVSWQTPQCINTFNGNVLSQSCNKSFPDKRCPSGKRFNQIDLSHREVQRENHDIFINIGFVTINLTIFQRFYLDGYKKCREITLYLAAFPYTKG